MRGKKYFTTMVLVSLAVSGTAFATPINSEVDPSLAGSTLLDFESGPAGTWTTQSFGGLTLTAVNSVYAPNATFLVSSDYAGNYNTRGRYNATNNGSTFQNLRLDFAAPVSAFGFLFGASDSSWTLTAYNGGDALESYIIAPVLGSNAGDFFGLAGLSGATYATLIQNQDYYYGYGGVDHVFLDNIRYSAAGAATIPEPGTIMLLAAGLVGAAVYGKHRKGV